MGHMARSEGPLAHFAAALRRCTRFSARTLLLAVTVAAIALGIFAERRSRVDRARRQVADLRGSISGRPGDLWLEFDLCHLRGKPMDWLPYLPGVTKAFARNAKVDAENIRALGRMKSLQELNLAFSTLKDAELDSLAGLEELRTLNVSGTECTLAGIAKLSRLPNLTDLNIDKLAGDELRLASFPQLVKLAVTEPRLVHVQLTDLPELKVLNLHLGEATVELRNLPLLYTLDVHLDHLGEMDLQQVPELSTVSLRVGGECPAARRAKLVEQLAALPSLEELRLQWFGMSAVDLATLAGAKRLVSLTIEDTETEIDAETLSRLVAIPTLKKLDMSAARLSAEAAAVVAEDRQTLELSLEITVPDDTIADLAAAGFAINEIQGMTLNSRRQLAQQINAKQQRSNPGRGR